MSEDSPCFNLSYLQQYHLGPLSCRSRQYAREENDIMHPSLNLMHAELIYTGLNEIL